MSDALRLATDRWPLVTLHLPADLRRLDLSGLRESQEAVFERGERYVSITDASFVEHLPDAHSRREIATFLNTVEDRTRRWQVANALVVPGSVARRVLTAIHWLAPPNVPTRVCATMDEGLSYLLPHAERAGLSIEMLR